MIHDEHKIVGIEPENDSAITAAHEKYVFLNPSKTEALIGQNRGNNSGTGEAALLVRFIGEGSNSLLDPERVSFAMIGQPRNDQIVVTLETLLYALKTLQDGAA